MEAVILCGVQGSGKTTLYRDRFLETHARVSMDLLRTRPRAAAFLRTCLETGMRFVVDNTNPTAADRRAALPPAALRDFARRFVRPTPEEGFDELWHVSGARIEPLLTTPPLF